MVQLEFTGRGTSIFAAATKRLVGRQIAIYMDDVLLSNPTVQGEITGGKAMISGNFTETTAKQLANQITEGPLPFALKIKSESIVTPPPK